MSPAEQQNEFIILIDQHKPMLYKVCNVYAVNEHDKQDLFQEIIVQLWRSYSSFRGESKFSTWLYRIALNTAISGLRRQRRFIDQVDPGDLPDKVPDVPFNNDTEAMMQLMYKAINQLSEVEKALVMLYLEDKSYDEMEDIMGINQNNLRVKMNRIKEKLRKITKKVEYGT